MDEKAKKLIAVVENYGNVEGDYAQLTPIVLKDLQKNKGMFKGKTLPEVKADPKLYDQVVEAYWNRMDDFGLSQNPVIKALWWYAPTDYKRTEGLIHKLNPDKRKLMQTRVNNMTVYLKPPASPYTGAIGGG